MLAREKGLAFAIEKLVYTVTWLLYLRAKIGGGASTRDRRGTKVLPSRNAVASIFTAPWPRK